jgi:hypothetical protein
MSIVTHETRALYCERRVLLEAVHAANQQQRTHDAKMLLRALTRTCALFRAECVAAGVTPAAVHLDMTGHLGTVPAPHL